MFARMLKCTLKPERKEEFLNAAQKLINSYAGQTGFLDLLTFVSDEHPYQALVVALWKSRSECDAFYKTTAPLLELQPFIAQHEVEHYYLESSAKFAAVTGKAA